MPIYFLTPSISSSSSGGGVNFTVSVNTTSGAIVNASKGDLVVSGVADDTGVCVLSLPEGGEWTVVAMTSDGESSDAMVINPNDFIVSCKIPLTLNDTSWQRISEISSAGQAANYWAIGDSKAVGLTGTLGDISLNEVNNTYYAYIIGINHNSSLEGENRIHFLFGKTALSGGKDICFVDAEYATGEEAGFMFNSDCWIDSDLRTVICPQFKACLPSELQAVLKTVTKYTDNESSGYSDYDGRITATTEDIFILAEWEVFGVNTYASTYEKNYQMQYTYYAAGNSKKKYKHSATGTTAIWWLRSHDPTSWPVCAVDSSGTITYVTGSASGAASYGFAPAFCV